MELVAFTSGLELGIELIDEQHAQFYNLLNKLLSADAEGASRGILDDIVEELSDYVYAHFRAEEELMADCGYPNLEAHHRQHAHFVNKVIDFNRQFRKGEIGLESEVIAYLETWFTNHIQCEDPKYVDLFKSRGL